MTVNVKQKFINNNKFCLLLLYCTLKEERYSLELKVTGFDFHFLRFSKSKIGYDKKTINELNGFSDFL